MEQGLVSVIMPTFNASKFLAGSIESVLNQTYTNLELLITDDGSTELATLDILKKFSAKDTRVRVAYTKGNLGAGCARNNAIERARGQYIAFCDSDDRWFPDKLERQIDFMNEKEIPMTFSSYVICDEDDKEIGINVAQSKVTYKDMLCDNKIGCLTAIYDAEAMGKKFYMPTLRKRQDWAMFINIAKELRVVYGMKETTAYYRKRKQSISKQKFGLVKYNVRVYEEVLGFSRAHAYLYFMFRFMPTYTLKVARRHIDSWTYKRLK